MRIVFRYRAAVLAIVGFLATATFARAMDVNFPAGATIDATVRREIDSKTARDGQRFTAFTSSGSRVDGHLSEVQRADFGRKAHLKLNVDTIAFADGTSMTLDAEVIGVGEKRQTKYTQAAGTVLGGMILGNIVGKNLGTNVGGLLGIAGGALLAANTSQDIVVPAGAAIRIRLKAPLVGRS